MYFCSDNLRMNLNSTINKVEYKIIRIMWQILKNKLTTGYVNLYRFNIISLYLLLSEKQQFPCFIRITHLYLMKYTILFVPYK